MKNMNILVRRRDKNWFINTLFNNCFIFYYIEYTPKYTPILHKSKSLSLSRACDARIPKVQILHVQNPAGWGIAWD